jgi:hypothetical protein
MNIDKKQLTQRIALLVLLLLLLAPLSWVIAQGQPAATPLIGTYAGSVTIDEPAALGALDLVINVTDNGGVLSGQVNGTKTQVFLGGPVFTGSVTSSQGITPTFRIDSELFTGQVSGRSVQRQFTLVGEVLKDMDTLRGQYTETITGFTPKPLLVKGKFLLVRPAGSQVLIPIPTATPTPSGGPGATPTPILTPTATSQPGTGNPLPRSLYLPLVSK